MNISIASLFRDRFSSTYDMVEQWITRDGPFQYDYDWLSQTGSKAELKAFADGRFTDTFGVHPDTAELLPPV